MTLLDFLLKLRSEGYQTFKRYYAGNGVEIIEMRRK